MNSLKLEREAIKKALRKYFREIENVDREDEKNINEFLQQIMDKAERVFTLDTNIKELLFSEVFSAEDLEKEIEEEENFRSEVIRYKNECDFLIKTIKEWKIEIRKETRVQKNFNLPKLEIKKFDGNVKNWINFWGQFRKIHEDADLPNEDKFQYLIQSTKEDSPARNLVESFPPSANNYKIAIDQLKTRFARDEILIEVYVRELLNLVLSQQTSGENSGMILSTLYDKLETQLRALETLGVTSDKYAAMLLPLVESALPYELLKIWERNRVSTNNKFNNELQGLLQFLKAEVEADERIKLAQCSFSMEKGVEIAQDRCSLEMLHVKNTEIKGKPSFSCIFCETFSHNSQDCIKAQKMPLEQKKAVLVKKKACFSCLKQNHSFKTCKSIVKCLKCTRKHYALMCPDLHERKKEDANEQERFEQTMTNIASQTLLQTVMVKMVSGNKSKTVRALLDSGSQRSYISTKCAEELKLTKIGEENIIQGMFGGIQSTPKIHRLFRANVQNLDRSFSIGVSLLEQDKICNFIPKLNDQNIINELKSKNIIVNDTASTDFEVNLLIGADIFGKIITGNLVNINDSLVAVETNLGWTIMGQQNCNKNNYFVSTYFVDSSLENLWNLDVLGIKEPAEQKCREELEIQTLEKFMESTIVNKENRYEVLLPWVDGCAAITSNLKLAENRLFSNTKRLISLNKFKDYDKVFDEWEQMGIIEEVEQDPFEEKVHYLAHHAVIKEANTTTKIRPVFDASAKDKKGNSLNDLLVKGPNMIELIIPLILKFRLHKIGVTADIAKAFLQISVTEKDRDYLRFLWWKNYEQKQIKIFRHCRVVFGLKPSPFLLAATLSLHLKNEKIFKDTADQLSNAFYVDNCVYSVKTETDLHKFIEESKEILKRANFDLRGWIYNKDKVENSKYVENSEDKIISILGIQWNYVTDSLMCQVKNLGIVDEIPRTKRGILSATQRIFDPIGFTAPFTLLPKLLLQETWSLKLTWDQKLPEDIENRFETWLKSVQFLNFCSIPRYLADPEDENMIKQKSLHIFVDASKLAYAACIFLRFEFQNYVFTKLLLAKSRLCPVKSVTLPRLELMAALIGVRLAETVKQVPEFKDLETTYWSDSMIVLTWIKTKCSWNTFVGNRIKEIKKFSNADQWRHVPGEMNTADVLSRGCNGKQLIEKKWWVGPEWLNKSREDWPKAEICAPEEEFMKESRNVVSTNLVKCSVDEEFWQKINKISKYTKIKRITGWILRFYNNLKNKQRNKCLDIKKKKKLEYLNSEELERAEVFLVKVVQRRDLKENIKGLRKFEIFEDPNGVLRMKTRLQFGDFPEDFKYPIILPSKSEIVRKLLIEEHENSCHAGPKILLGVIREKFWLLKARKTINSIIFACVICRKQTSKPIETPFAPLPKNRINDAAVFEITGVDLAGPLFLKEGGKAWVVLFTCAVYRALHLELVKSLSTEAFLYALRRFISRRGRPIVIYSDNATNFHGSDNLFGKLNWDEIENFSGLKRIKWLFNPPSASWWGGWWERLVRVVKELLRRTLGKASLYYVELYTVLCDVEAVVNDRPLTYVSDVDEYEVLTPAGFIKPIHNASAGMGLSCEVGDLDQVDSQFLKGRFIHLQKIRVLLRERFKKEYLAELVNIGHRRKDTLKIGNIVLVGSDNMKRATWTMGRITEIYEGRDGVNRVAKVRTKNGELVRPFQRLYPLELPCEQTATEVTHSTKSKSVYGCKEKNEENIDPIAAARTSRFGRVLKAPVKFGDS